MLLSGWVALTAVERWAEQAPWSSAVLRGLLWACVVAGVWWFAEWTQSPLRTARESAAARESERRRASAAAGESDTRREAETAGAGQSGTAHEPGAAPAPEDETPHERRADVGAQVTRRPDSSTPSRR
ncbi:hypothetical protein [Streptomyces sp. NPDC057287]|uniref:hypothetical protein n=1 Tax=Streptomyces sp. NPDC057287 TaxID=3346086 RepID=UPI00364185F2